MKPLNLTRHAQTRMNQRGLRSDDLALLLSAATPLANDTLLMTDAAADREIAKRKREIERLQRLRGCKVVVGDDVIVTVCHTSRSSRRKALRKGREVR